jgi:hypothetical protein
MSSPAVKPPVSYGPHGFSPTALELLGVEPMRESTEIWYEEMSAEARNPFIAELVREIKTHDPRSQTSLVQGLYFICRRHKKSILEESLMWLKQSFPYIPWDELMTVSYREP